MQFLRHQHSVAAAGPFTVRDRTLHKCYELITQLKNPK